MVSPVSNLSATMAELLACAMFRPHNQLYTRLNGIQLILNAEIDYFHVISIFKKLLTKN